jgi:hypothetical protein
MDMEQIKKTNRAPVGQNGNINIKEAMTLIECQTDAEHVYCI